MLPPSPHPQMPTTTITVHGTPKLLENINSSKAPGPDNIPARVWKEAATPIAPMLAYIFQQSLDKGVVPEDWKIANITPIFKKNDRSKPSITTTQSHLPVFAVNWWSTYL